MTIDVKANGFGPPETMYCAEQIRIPPELPEILKTYTKYVIKTQPQDILAASAEYFGKLAKQRFKAISAEKRLSNQQMESYYRKFTSANQASFTKKTLHEICADVPPAQLSDVLSLGGWTDDIPYLKFWSLLLASNSGTLHSTMEAACEILGDDGYIAMQPFKDIFSFLADRDPNVPNSQATRFLKSCGTQAQDDRIEIKFLVETLKLDIPQKFDIQPVESANAASVGRRQMSEAHNVKVPSKVELPIDSKIVEAALAAAAAASEEEKEVEAAPAAVVPDAMEVDSKPSEESTEQVVQPMATEEAGAVETPTAVEEQTAQVEAPPADEKEAPAVVEAVSTEDADVPVAETTEVGEEVTPVETEAPASTAPEPTEETAEAPEITENQEEKPQEPAESEATEAEQQNPQEPVETQEEAAPAEPVAEKPGEISKEPSAVALESAPEVQQDEAPQEEAATQDVAEEASPNEAIADVPPPTNEETQEETTEVNEPVSDAPPAPEEAAEGGEQPEEQQ